MGQYFYPILTLSVLHSGGYARLTNWHKKHRTSYSTRMLDATATAMVQILSQFQTPRFPTWSCLSRSSKGSRSSGHTQVEDRASVAGKSCLKYPTSDAVTFQQIPLQKCDHFSNRQTLCTQLKAVSVGDSELEVFLLSLLWLLNTPTARWA
jgi:hypothetical protein